MKYFKFSLVAAVAMTIAAFGSLASAQNLFVNPGFEDPVTNDGPPFVGSWEAFSGGAPLSQNSSIMPRSGAQHLELFIDNQGTTFAGAFQDVLVTPGNEYTFSG